MPCSFLPAAGIEFGLLHASLVTTAVKQFREAARYRMGLKQARAVKIPSFAAQDKADWNDAVRPRQV